MSKGPKIAVIGAGSIGGFLGATLALAGEDVTFIGRGDTLAALKKGFTLIDTEGQRHAVPAKAQAITDGGAFDLVILGLKAQQIGPVAPHLMGLLAPDAPILAVQNGIPWWYFHKSGGDLEGRRVTAVDPDGAITKAIDSTRVIGGVIYVAASVVAPGVVHVTETNHMAIGEPDNTTSARGANIAARLSQAGFKTVVSPDIRTTIWTKLWGNSVFNPISALTRAGLAAMATDTNVRPLAATVMTEVEAVAAKFGVKMPMTVDQRIDLAATLGGHKTSMLQDIEAGRAPELDANVGAVAELARMVGVPTPMLNTLYACTRLLAQTVAGGR